MFTVADSEDENSYNRINAWLVMFQEYSRCLENQWSFMAKEVGKLGSLLALLDVDAWERLRIFLQSPWFNRSATVRQLMEHYAAALSAGNPIGGDSAVYALIFPGHPYDPIKLKNLRAALQRKVEDFLSQSAYSNDTGLHGMLLLRQLNALNESHYFPKYHEKVLELIQAHPMEEERKQLNLFQAMDEWEGAQIRLSDRSQGAGDVSAYHHAWAFFQLQTVKFLVRQANLGAIDGPSGDLQQAEMILSMVRIDHEAAPALRLYCQLLAVFRQPTDRAIFETFRQLLQATVSLVAMPDASDIYTGAINHCIRRINMGEAEFAPIMLELYQQMDTYDLMLHNGRIPAPQFKNMVGLALRFRAFDWAQTVIDRYGKQLDQDPHRNAEGFNQGMLHFAQGNFEAAERCFYRVLQAYEDVFFGLDARSYLLRIHYETGNWTGLESLAESFKMYLKRNKRIPKSHRESYLHTAKFFAKLARLADWNRKGLQNLRAAVERTPFAATSKQWLLQKIDARLDMR
jgi:hypothetical protein